MCVCFCAFFPSFTHRAVKKEFINLAKIIAPSRRDVQVIAAQQRGDCRINSRNAASTTRHRHTSPSKAWQVDSKSGPLEGGKMCSKASLMESYLINYTGSCLFSSPRAPFCLVLSFQLAVFFSRHDDNILYSLSYLPRLLLLIVFFLVFRNGEWKGRESDVHCGRKQLKRLKRQLKESIGSLFLFVTSSKDRGFSRGMK